MELVERYQQQFSQAKRNENEQKKLNKPASVHDVSRNGHSVHGKLYHQQFGFQLQEDGIRDNNEAFPP